MHLHPYLKLESYLVELRVPGGAGCIGQQLRELDGAADDAGVQILGLVRDGERLPGMAARSVLLADDRIVVEGGPEGIDGFAGALALSYADSDRPSKAMSGNTIMREVAVPQTSRLVGRTESALRLRYRRGVILLGISRSGLRIRERLREVEIQAGDEKPSSSLPRPFCSRVWNLYTCPLLSQVSRFYTSCSISCRFRRSTNRSSGP